MGQPFGTASRVGIGARACPAEAAPPGPKACLMGWLPGNEAGKNDWPAMATVGFKQA
jgi:hypothetical protein